MAFPAQVLIIRHGEKLGDPAEEQDGGPDLSVRGSARAAALPTLFAPAAPSQLSCEVAKATDGFSGTYLPVSVGGNAPQFPMPDFIFATARSDRSNRPVETITPLAAALHLEFNHKHAEEDYGTVARDILTHPKYAGKVVLICWHHGKIPGLASALGIASPPAWPGTVFDAVWQITWPNAQATLSSQWQRLLYGDT